MKLIDLLVSHLGSNGGWPIGAEVCAQDNDCEVVFYSRPGIHRRGNNLVWTIPEGVQSVVVKRRIYITLADDTDTAVVSREQYESALAASQQSAWNGDGLPPVGCECEALYDSDDEEWLRVIILAHDVESVIGRWIDGEKEGQLLDYPKRPSSFRPIRTEAERKREEAKNVIAELCRSSASNGHSADLIYDAIAAGKIPHITLK